MLSTDDVSYGLRQILMIRQKDIPPALLKQNTIKDSLEIVEKDSSEFSESRVIIHTNEIQLNLKTVDFPAFCVSKINVW